MHTSALPFFGLIRVSGEDRASFLHGQLSNHIEGLAEGEACYATYNTPKGRVIANMLVFNCGEDLLLLTAADLVEALCKRLRMFVLRAKAVFEPLPGYGAAGRLNEGATALPAAEPHLSFPFAVSDGLIECTLPHGGTLLAGEKDKLPAYDAEAENAWQLHEIRSGYPWISEATKESCVAQMLNQHTIGGVHFKKGCYPGQEIIARAQYRGQVKRGLAVLSRRHRHPARRCGSGHHHQHRLHRRRQPEPGRHQTQRGRRPAYRCRRQPAATTATLLRYGGSGIKPAAADEAV